MSEKIVEKLNEIAVAMGGSATTEGTVCDALDEIKEVAGASGGGGIVTLYVDTNESGKGTATAPYTFYTDKNKTTALNSYAAMTSACDGKWAIIEFIDSPQDTTSTTIAYQKNVMSTETEDGYVFSFGNDYYGGYYASTK